MQTILILRGLPASGKSTYAKRLVKENPNVYKRINRDTLREMFDEYQLTKENEQFVKKVRDLLISEALKTGLSVVVDDTNLSDKNINRIRQLADIYRKETRNDVEVVIKDFDIELEEAIKRDAERKRPVGKEVIKKLHRQFYTDEKFDDRGPHYSTQDETLTPAIICDLDGTLAIISDRNPFDASKCENDLLNSPVADIIKTYASLETKIILLSGRTDDHREQTKRWLAKHEIPYDELLMRKKGDTRKDAVIKKEIVEVNIKGKYFVKFTLDDRDQVVDMWRNDLGYACLQVNYGNF